MPASRPLLLLVPALLVLTSCASKGPLACPGTTQRTARVYFATDRKQTASEPILQFGGSRTDPPKLNVGWEEVRFGPQHILGRLDPAVVITPVHSKSNTQENAPGAPLDRSDAEISVFIERTIRPAIRASVPARAGQPRQVLLYVHGYNNGFDEALRKAGQLAADLGMIDCDGRPRGVPIAYSWPAQQSLLTYAADEENVEWTQQRLAPFLLKLAAVCQQERAELHLVGHSMGSRALVRSLAQIANARSAKGQPFEQIVLLAPDIEKGIFDQYVQRALPLVRHITLYVSARDRALTLSRLLHGGHDRVGLIETTLLSALKLTGLATEDHRELGFSVGAAGAGKADMIDVSTGLAASLGHTYEDPSFIRDLRELIDNNTPAGQGARAHLKPREASTNLFRSLSGEKLRYFQLGRDNP